jgi:predicted dinucleotide-binding enzyme
MQIGIIGAGQVGGTLARKLSALGHTVRLANSRGPDTLATLAAAAGATPVHATDAARSAEVVIVAIPEKSVPLLPRDLFAGVADDVVVVDTGNYYPGLRDDPVAAIEQGVPESRWVATQLGRPVVKAFNNVLADSLATRGRPAGAPGRIALPVAGDDARAKAIVIGLVDALGFDGIDAGSLDDSWRQQPGTPAYCTDLPADDLRRALAAADRGRAPQLRDLAMQRFGELGPNATTDDLVAMSRGLHDAT